MKDYLNTQERDEFITFIKSLDQGGRIEQYWNERNNLTKEELKSLRMVITWGKKFATSMINRQNDASRKTVGKILRSSSVMLDYRSTLDGLLKKRCIDIEASYEENKDYFKLVELLMHYNCRECTRKCSECEIYKEFEIQHIPEFEGKDNGLCKYSYTLKEDK